MKMRILVTGASGFIGNKLLQRFSKLNLDIVIHTRVKPSNINSKILVLNGELSEFSNQIITFSPNLIYHLAGSSNYPSEIKDEYELWNSNLIYGTTLLRIIKELPDVIFVNFSSSLSYKGESIFPYNYYALTKANFIYALDFYTQRTSLRVFNLILYTVYGQGDRAKRAINYIIDSLDSSDTILMSPGEQEMDFIYVDDVISLCEQLLYIKPIYLREDIHVGTGVGTSLEKVSKIINKITNKKPNINFGGITYRVDEKKQNIAIIKNNRFWKYTISLEEGLAKLFKL